MGSHIRRRSKITTCECVPRHPRCAGPRIENWINANIAIAWKVVIYLCDSSAVRVGVINAFTAALREPAKGFPGIVGLFAKVTATSHSVCRYLGIPWGYFGCKQRRGASYTGMCVYTSNCKSVIVWDRVVRVEAFKKVREMPQAIRPRQMVDFPCGSRDPNWISKRLRRRTRLLKRAYQSLISRVRRVAIPILSDGNDD